MKNPYDLLNETQINVDEYEEVELNQAEKDRLLHTLQKSVQPRTKKPRKGLIAAAVALAMISPVMLSNEHVWASLSKAGKQIEQFFNKPDNQFIGYKQKIEQVAADKNVSVTLNELMLDDGQILLSLNVNAAQLDKLTLGAGKSSPIRPGDPIIQIGDVTFSNTAYDSQLEDEKTEDGSWNFLYSVDLTGIDTDGDGIIDKENFQILDDYMNSDKDYDVNITFHTMEYEKKSGVHSGKYSDSFGQIKGNWAFQTTVNGTNIKSDTDVYYVDKEISIKEKDVEGILKIEEVRVSPVSLKLHYTFEYTKGSQMETNVDLLIEDEKGRRLTGSGTGTGTDTLSTMNIDIPLENDLKQIKITPTLFDYESESSKYLKDKAFELKLQK
ncbi:DUF4179 domain-containing protein [Bacillus sp. REN10]|uniref:DUF4179 domain-containing protein n=1 Tax=Bacillus sp. REN10 TaxID=2782541 RepID=UPI00193BCE9D|nr:DUF4179 domain-containing protein [Bacillus sp. REN10]